MATEFDCTTRNRINWIDLAKGITIILTIVGHSVSTGTIGAPLRGIIFSFHMPLFFILSCITYRYSGSLKELWAMLKRSAKHLLIPALVVQLILVIYNFIEKPSRLTDPGYYIGKLNTWIYASGVKFSVNGTEIFAIGITWFLIVLFLGRIAFDGLQLLLKNKILLYIASCIIGIAGVILGQLQWLPFSIDIALAVFPFFCFGYYLKNHPIKKGSFPKLFICFIVWIGTFGLTYFTRYTYLELAARTYTLFPLCYLTAAAGTLFIAYLSIELCKLGKITKPLIYVGKNSLYLLCIHAIDRIFKVCWNFDSQWTTMVVRIVLDLIVFVLFMLLRKLIKQWISQNKNRKQIIE